MVLSVISRLGLIVLITFSSCSRNKVAKTPAVPEVWLTFTDQKSGQFPFQIEEISAEWSGRALHIAVAAADGSMLQIQQLETDTLPGKYEGGTFKLVYMPGNFKTACISTQVKKNSLEIVKTEKGYLLQLKGVFDCPDHNFSVAGSLPISEPERPLRTTYPTSR